jgi:hypothetical protein
LEPPTVPPTVTRAPRSPLPPTLTTISDGRIVTDSIRAASELFAHDDLRAVEPVVRQTRSGEEG